MLKYYNHYLFGLISCLILLLVCDWLRGCKWQCRSCSRGMTYLRLRINYKTTGLWRHITVGFAPWVCHGPRGPAGAGDMGTYTWMIVFLSCVTARRSLKTPCIVVGFTMSAASFGESFQEQQESLFLALIAWIRVSPGVRVALQRLDKGVFSLILERGDSPHVVLAKGSAYVPHCVWSTNRAANVPLLCITFCSQRPRDPGICCLKIRVKCSVCSSM